MNGTNSPCLNLSYLHGGEVVYQPGQSIAERVLADYELVYIIEGNVRYISGGTTYFVGPGALILGRPGGCESYQWDPEKRTRHAFFHFGIESLPADWPPPQEWPRVRNTNGPLAASLFRHILQHMYERNELGIRRPNRSEARLVEVLLDTLLEEPHAEITSFERERPEPVRRALLHLRQLAEESPEYMLHLSDLAHVAGTTEKYLCRLFAKWVGSSPMQTYTLLKLEMARALLTRTNLSVKEIATRTGFDNPLYFSRRFSKAFGCSPSAFRTNLASGEPASGRYLLPIDLLPRGLA